MNEQKQRLYPAEIDRQCSTLDMMYLEWSNFTSAKTAKDIANEKRITELQSRLKAVEQENEGLSQNICDECEPGENYGWKFNAVEGRHPCTCIEESGAYQELASRLKAVEGLPDKWRTPCDDYREKPPSAWESAWECADELEAAIQGRF